MWRRLGKVFLIIYLVVAFIADVIVFVYFAGEEDAVLAGLIAFLGIGVGILLSAVIFGILLEMAKNLEVIASNTSQMGHATGNVSVSNSSGNISNGRVDVTAAGNSTSSTWHCKQCSTANTAQAIFCKNCGNMKK